MVSTLEGSDQVRSRWRVQRTIRALGGLRVRGSNLEDGDNLVLVLGKDLGKPVALFTHLEDVLVPMEELGVTLFGLT